MKYLRERFVDCEMYKGTRKAAPRKGVQYQNNDHEIEGVPAAPNIDVDPDASKLFVSRTCTLGHADGIHSTRAPLSLRCTIRSTLVCKRGNVVT